MRKLLLLTALGVLASLTLAACGGDDDGGDETTADTTTQTTTTQAGGGGGGGGGTISLSADPGGSIAYEQASLSGQAGNTTIELDNPAPLAHDVCVEDPSGNELGCSETVEEDTTSLTVNLEPGTYTFYCSVDGHRAGGMEGPLTIE